MSIGKSSVPHNVLELEDNDFFEFVKFFSGAKLASLIEFQDINTAQCLLACDDPFYILSLDSDDLLDLQKKTCVKLNSNGFVVLPGLTCKMKFLKGALLRKRNELKKKAKIRTNVNTTIDTSLSNQVMNNVTNLTQVSIQESINSLSSTTDTYTTEDKLKQHLIHLINDWCTKTADSNDRSAFRLKEDVDYQIMINLLSDKVIIECQCGAKSLSNFIRHLTHKKPCSMVQQKLVDIRENTSINVVTDNNHINEPVNEEINIISNSASSVSPQREKRTRNRTLESSLSKKKKST
ncbi:unnamed protein product [Adineta steineri]|uniref:Uncharacterized protein n=1 Tax=Adineta steineri TaxID=433720 RepID=A0A819FZD7_9BILA|nr:unnamed protein product [Adineta steineri]